MSVVEIENIDDLQAMNNTLSSEHILMNDIDASDTTTWNGGEGFKPIGEDFPDEFYGILDGRGFIIKGLYINRPTRDYTGLFAYNVGVLENIVLEDVEIIGKDDVGGIAGMNDYIIKNCLVKGLVTGENYVGGITGYNTYNLGWNTFTGTVTGNDFVGGVAGTNRHMGLLFESFSYGSITGNNRVGGLLGHDKGETKRCKSHMDVQGNDYVGGLIGECGEFINHGIYLKQCCAHGNVQGNNRIGGLTGFLNTTTDDVYARGNVQGNDYVGGLIGYCLERVLTHGYSTGLVQGTTNKGGLVGGSFPGFTPTVVNSFWDTITSGQTISDGGTGKTTTELKQISTYETWDIETLRHHETETWWLQEQADYPRLSWETKPTNPMKMLSDVVVERQGQPITHIKHVSTGLNEFDEPNITTTETTIYAYLSSKTEREAIRHEGRFGSFDLVATILHDTDVRVDRSGGNDIFIINDTPFKVVGIDQIHHPLSKQEKQKIFLQKLVGRETP